MSQTSGHILVCLDFSDSAALALSKALQLAERLGATLHLCHIAQSTGIVAPSDLGLNVPMEFPDAQEARVRLQQVQAQLGSRVPTTLHCRMGNPVDTMLALIQEIKPEMVVVGSHGKGLLRRALLGSVSTELAHRSPVPVLVVPAPGRDAILHQPPPPVEPELPSVGQAVAEFGGGATGVGIAGVGGGNFNLR